MKNFLGMFMTAALFTSLLVGCEKEEPPVPQEPAGEERSTEGKAATSPPTAANRETEMEATQEEKAALPVINERIEEEADQRDQLEPGKEMEGDTQQMAGGEQPAGTGSGEMPESVTYDASFGPVTFPHAAHAEMLGCGSCHETDPPQRIVIDKERAHDMCKGCHQERGAGPTGCRGCHQKEE